MHMAAQINDRNLYVHKAHIMEIKKYKIGLGNMDGVYLRCSDQGKLYFSDTGRMHYFAYRGVAENWINKISMKFGEKWKSRMHVYETIEYLMKDVDLCGIDGIFKGWEDCIYETPVYDD